MRFFSDIINLFYPQVCCTCGKRLSEASELICFKCRNELPKVKFPLLEDNELTNRFLGKLDLKFGAAYLYFFKSGISQELMHAFKYKNQPELGHMIGTYLGYDLVHDPVSQHIDMIVPVPLHPKKLRKRGYNQSAIFAQGLSDSMTIPIAADVLIRTVHGESQTHISREERLKNVHATFQVMDREVIKSKSILLVDDVITTGATLEACGIQLLEAGAARLSIATMAIAK